MTEETAEVNGYFKTRFRGHELSWEVGVPREVPKLSVERFYSSGQRPHWFNETKERICIKNRVEVLECLYTDLAVVHLFWY